MKTQNKFFVLFGLSALALLLLGLGLTLPLQAAEPAVNDSQSVHASQVTALTANEIAGLQYMREEEKLAHDVYAAMYAKYNLPIFNNISRSEAQHTSAVKNLLDRYGIPDPAAGKAAGEFTNPELQALYDQLMAQGNLSVNDALKVGVVIEQTDIQDLQTRLAATTQWDVQRVYSNLLRGSQNHLRAFQRFVK